MPGSSRFPKVALCFSKWSVYQLTFSSDQALPVCLLFCLFSAESGMLVAVEWWSFNLLPIRQTWFGFFFLLLCFVKWSPRKDPSSTGLIIPFNPDYKVMCPKHEYGFNTIITTAFSSSYFLTFLPWLSIKKCLGSFAAFPHTPGAL